MKVVERGEHTQANGGAAAEPTGWGNRASDMETIRLGGSLTGVEVGVDYFIGKWVRFG